MFKSKCFLLSIVLIISFCVPLAGDIIITKDDMILNGKILEEKKDDFIKFGNYHGEFHIEFRLIKEIHRTKSYKEDIKIFKDKGKAVNETEVMINYQSGLEKLEEQRSVSGDKVKEEESKEKIVLLLSPFYNFNIGKLSGELPRSFGGSVTGYFTFNQFGSIRQLYMSGVAVEAGYFYSEKEGKQVSGPRVSVGPLWSFSLASGEINVSYVASPLIGFGWYAIKGRYEDAVEIKLNTVFITGPVFNFSSFMLAPLFRFDSIYDSAEPLYGIGFTIAAGVKF